MTDAELVTTTNKAAEDEKLIGIVRRAYEGALAMQDPWADAVDEALAHAGIPTRWDDAMEGATTIMVVAADGRAVECTDDGRWIVHPWAFRSQINALRSEAEASGDWAQVSICDSALDRDAMGIIECGRVIAAAKAQQ